MSKLLQRKSVLVVKDYLQNINPSIELIVLDDSARTAQDAANSLNRDVGSIVKSLLFKDTNNDYYLCLVSGDKYLSTGNLSQITGDNIKKAGAEEIKKHTGFSIGGVSPVAHKYPPKRIFIDKNLSRFKTLYAAAGHPYVVFGITYNELITITNAEEDNITE